MNHVGWVVLLDLLSSLGGVSGCCNTGCYLLYFSLRLVFSLFAGLRIVLVV